MQQILNQIYTACWVQPTEQQYRGFAVLKYAVVAAGLYHAFFIVIFGWLGVPDMAVFNVFSVIAYAVAYILNNRGKWLAAYMITVAEIISHAVLAVINVGWDSGFCLYLLCVVPFTFFVLNTARLAKLIICTLMVFAYIIVYLQYSFVEPVVVIAPHAMKIVYCLNIAAMAFSFLALSYCYEQATYKAEAELVKANEKLDKLAGTDPLTGLLNRRSMMKKIAALIQQYEKTGQSFGIVIVDVDDFKQINDMFGHECGDIMLCKLASVMKQAIVNAQFARWGGEEFMILLPEADKEQCKQWTEKLRRAVAETLLDYNNRTIQATITCGASIFDGQTCVETVIKQADHAMYVGKQNGKNRVILETISLSAEAEKKSNI